MSATHAYYVRRVVPGGPLGVDKFRPACECGWTAVDQDDEATAVEMAFEHATGKPIPPPGNDDSTTEAASGGGHVQRLDLRAAGMDEAVTA